MCCAPKQENNFIDLSEMPYMCTQQLAKFPKLSQKFGQLGFTDCLVIYNWLFLEPKHNFLNYHLQPGSKALAWNSAAAAL